MLESGGNELPVAVNFLGEGLKFGNATLSRPFEPSAKSKASVLKIVLLEDQAQTLFPKICRIEYGICFDVILQLRLLTRRKIFRIL